jgi:hypothetical protein
MGDVQPRWLDCEEVARYLSVRVDRVAALVRAGRIPEPTYHLGPRSPRWDRLALDSVLGDGTASSNARTVVSNLVQDILTKGRARRAAKAGGRQRLCARAKRRSARAEGDVSASSVHQSGHAASMALRLRPACRNAPRSDLASKLSAIRLAIGHKSAAPPC